LIVDLVLNNANAYIKNGIVNCSIAVDHGKIIRIGREASMPHAAGKVDLKNLLVLPGLIDAHVHLRDEGKTYKEDFFSGTAAAAAGGFTTVLDMPNNKPTTMSMETLRNRMRIAAKKLLVNVGFYSEFPEDTNEIERIVEEGIVAFKLFMTEQVGGLDVSDEHALLRAFRNLSSLGIPVAVHAEDRVLLEKNRGRLERTSQNGVQAFLKAHSENVEVKAIYRIIGIAKRVKTHVHFCHVSTRKGLGAICNEKALSMPITCETTPHNLFLTADDLVKAGMLAVTMPPVRERKHITALWRGVKDGCVDILASDHAPHALEEKKAKSVWNVKVGIPGLETTLPLLLTAVKLGRLSLADVVRLMSKKPAEIFGLKGRGSLEEGNVADLTVVDLNREYKIDASKFHSKAKYSPFDGWKVEGKPVKAFVNGKLVMDEGEIVAEIGIGKIVRRE
jgi:dihydroorotase (multifunctional complex type)